MAITARRLLPVWRCLPRAYQRAWQLPWRAVGLRLVAHANVGQYCGGIPGDPVVIAGYAAWRRSERYANRTDNTGQSVAHPWRA